MLADARINFIRKVSLLATIQIWLTFLKCLICYKSPFLTRIVSSPLVLIVAGVTFLVLMIAMSCFECARAYIKKYPLQSFVFYSLVASTLIDAMVVGLQSRVLLTALIMSLLVSTLLTLCYCTYRIT